MKQKYEAIDIKSKTKQLEEETRAMEEKLRLLKTLKAGYDDKKSSKQMAFQIKTKKTISVKNTVSTQKTDTINTQNDTGLRNNDFKDGENVRSDNLESFLKEINKRDEAYLRVLKKAGCFEYKDRFTKNGIETIDRLAECEPEIFNTFGMTRKMQVQLENAIIEERVTSIMNHSDLRGVDFIMQTDDLHEDDQFETNIGSNQNNQYQNSNLDVIDLNNLDQLGDDNIDLGKLIGLRLPTDTVVNEKVPENEEKELNYAVCYTCYGPVVVDVFKNNDLNFCSDICYLAYNNRQNQLELKISEYRTQARRYEDLAIQTSMNVDNILPDNIIHAHNNKVDIDLVEDIEIHYYADRLITRPN